MSNFWNHIRTIIIHKKYVRKMCFKMGIPWLGLVHDLSKFSIEELKIAKYYDGTRSPHEVLREQLGYSPVWRHHYSKNKHHWQYWLDIQDWPDKVMAAKMPYKYVIEMFCDMVGASKAYGRKKEKWEEQEVWSYWEKACEGKRLMHIDSEYLIKKLLKLFAQLGEKEFLSWYKKSKKILKKEYNNGTIIFKDLSDLFLSSLEV